jgi:transposase-like protein
MPNPTPWTCPACDRHFGRRNQSHTCAPAMSVDAYFAARPAAHRRTPFTVSPNSPTNTRQCVDASESGIFVE